MSGDRWQRRRCRAWSQTEFDKLREYFPVLTSAEVATRLGRNIAAVRKKAGLLGLKKTPDLIAVIAPTAAQAHASRLEKYIPVPESGCWLWDGCWDDRYYGRIPFARPVTAHRYFYMHLVGPIPDGLSVCHKCDTPPCVNPDHLFLGTHQDNMRDMIRKGRNRGGRNNLKKGVSNGTA